MRLLILHIAYVFGGAERTTSNLLNYLNRERIKHITLAAPLILRDLLPANYDNFIDTTPYLREGWFHSPRSLFADIRACSQILREAKPDVALGMMHYSASLIILGTRLAQLPIQTIGSYRGPIHEYLKRNERTLWRQLYLRTLITATTRLAKCMIVPSTGTAQELIYHFGGSLKNTVVIPNGIDIDQVQTLAAAPAIGLESLSVKLPLLCLVARLAPEKDLDVFLAAFRLVQQQQPAALIIVGDGPERSKMENQLREWGLIEKVFFVGQRKNVYPYLRCADIFIHTCQFEGFGYTMLEALACGTPVIATDCPYGPREILGNQKYGLLTPPQDAQALAHAIVTLLQNQEQRQLLAERGLVRARELSIEKMIQGYETTFLQMYHQAGAAT